PRAASRSAATVAWPAAAAALLAFTGWFFFRGGSPGAPDGFVPVPVAREAAGTDRSAAGGPPAGGIPGREDAAVTLPGPHARAKAGNASLPRRPAACRAPPRRPRFPGQAASAWRSRARTAP